MNAVTTDAPPLADTAPRVSAVMPCLNEELTLARCIRKAQQCFLDLGVSGEVIIADNGSSDRSVSIAIGLGARVVHQPLPGYGAALMMGIEAARGEYVVIADADDSYDWLAMKPFLERLDAGSDLVIGNRFRGGIGPGAMPPLHRYLGNPVLSWLARATHGAPVGDFHCGMRALRRAAWERMRMRTPGMEFATEMIVNSVQAGLRIAEVPTTLTKDGRDRAPHLRSFRDGWRHLRFILTYAPDFLYFAPGGALFLIGALLTGLLAGGPTTLAGHYLGIHFLALGCLLTLMGFNVMNLGVLAKVIAMRLSPARPSTVARWAVRRFSLEGGLIAGVALILAGGAVDVDLICTWLRAPGEPMESTVHLVFVATLMIVLGFNLVFGSFLLSMLVNEELAAQRPRR
jgi:glycosyltransferase involved in cell wall biosynthesis